jgi:CubicO group peptidase (beta-lactamase class C family)
MIDVQGYWPTSWQPLVEVFAEHFARAGEEGAALAIYRDGHPVASLWAGERSNGGSVAPWEEDTAVNIFSASKGLVALCVLQLVARGQLALDAAVADYWPDFAQGGKGSITLRQLLCHRSGLSAFKTRQADSAIYDWDGVIASIAGETPWWQPDTAQGYSPFLYGWMLGELVRRVSGYRDFNAYFQAEVAGPLGIRCQFGVAPADQPELADGRPQKRSLAELANSNGADSAALGLLMKADPRGVTNRAFTNPMSLMLATNTPEWRQAQIPAANGHASAHALAGVYGALANNGRSAEGTELLPGDYLPHCWQEQSFEQDRVLGLPLRFSHGFMLSQPRPDCRFGRGARAFGHPGAGGCLGFADPDYRLGFGYVTARMGQSILIDQRAIRLIDTLYSLLEGDA